MKTIFLTSSLEHTVKTESGRVAKKCDNSNHFVDRLKAHIKKIKTLVFFASDPNGYERTDSFANLVKESLNLDGFGIENIVIIDHRFKGNLKQTVISADAIFLAGGHVPKQNAFFKEIGLKEILKSYNGIIIGQSAGSINLAEEVYVQPECEEEFRDKNWVKLVSGLAQTKIKIEPHMNRAKTDEIDGTTTFDMCVADSTTIPHYGIYDGGFIEISQGKAISFGKTLLFANGNCYQLCSDGECVEVNESYSHDLEEKLLLN